MSGLNHRDRLSRREEFNHCIVAGICAGDFDKLNHQDVKKRRTRFSKVRRKAGKLQSLIE